MKISGFVRGDLSIDNKVALLNVIGNSIPVLLGFLVQIKGNSLLCVGAVSVSKQRLLSVRHLAQRCAVCFQSLVGIVTTSISETTRLSSEKLCNLLLVTQLRNSRAKIQNQIYGGFFLLVFRLVILS